MPVPMEKDVSTGIRRQNIAKLKPSKDDNSQKPKQVWVLRQDTPRSCLSRPGLAAAVLLQERKAHRRHDFRSFPNLNEEACHKHLYLHRSLPCNPISPASTSPPELPQPETPHSTMGHLAFAEHAATC
jgi:hypothetical protein